MSSKRKLWTAIAAIVIVAVLAAAFFLGGDNDTVPEKPLETAFKTPAPDESLAPEENENTENDTPPEPTEPPKPEKSDGTYSCTISISCADLLPKLDLCAPEVAAIIPSNGWILRPVTVTFTEGESVFDVLKRVCTENGIHMEFSGTSAYIEGIGNLYEFDAGELSGWLYSVNGWFPNYGCSRYKLSDGDTICWVYSTDKSAYGVA